MECRTAATLLCRTSSSIKEVAAVAASAGEANAAELKVTASARANGDYPKLPTRSVAVPLIKLRALMLGLQLRRIFRRIPRRACLILHYHHRPAGTRPLHQSPVKLVLPIRVLRTTPPVRYQAVNPVILITACVLGPHRIWREDSKGHDQAK